MVAIARYPDRILLKGHKSTSTFINQGSTDEANVATQRDSRTQVFGQRPCNRKVAVPQSPLSLPHPRTVAFSWHPFVSDTRSAQRTCMILQLLLPIIIVIRCYAPCPAILFPTLPSQRFLQDAPSLITVLISTILSVIQHALPVTRFLPSVIRLTQVAPMPWRRVVAASRQMSGQLDSS